MAAPTAFITHADCRKHDMGAFHPESPQRLAAIEDRLISAGLHAHLQHVEAPLAKREHLLRAHSAAYVDDIVEGAPRQGTRPLDPDTLMNPHSLQAALRAAGGVVHGVDLVIQGKAPNAFCCVRPPGHHALSDRAMGFCIFNNVAIGALHAVEQHGVKRVAVLDFDVHHGNGTEAIFAGEPRAMLCSSFQHPFYPYQGADTMSERIVNTPLAAGADGQALRKVVTQTWLPALERFKPEFVLISAGFDAHRDDPLAHLNFVEADYAWVTQEIVEVARRFANGRVVSTLEGGYDLDALGRSAAEHVRVLAGL